MRRKKLNFKLKVVSILIQINYSGIPLINISINQVLQHTNGMYFQSFVNQFKRKD